MTECRNGYTYKNGKCSKRSKNPFKILGSWVGAIVGILFIYLYVYKDILNTGLLSENILVLLIILILGFLLGWGIHSLIRRIFK